ncbi:MAG: ribonuclease HII [Bdellovibrionota bacterium]
MRASPNLDYERQAGYPGLPVIGVDEVGRGCLAGEVVAAAAVVPRDPAAWDLERNPWIGELTDSKLLAAADRERLAAHLKGWLEFFAVAQASVAEIDRFNILRASQLAMERAVEQVALRLPESKVEVLVDGNQIPRGLISGVLSDGSTSHILKQVVARSLKTIASLRQARP